MAASGDFLRSLGVPFPIIQAPMGGADTPALTAAVCNSGGLGSLAAAYLTPDQISKAIARVRELTDKPFNVNLFAAGYAYGASAPADSGPSLADGAPMLALLAEIHQALELPAPSLPAPPADPFNDQLEAILDARPAIFSFTFGIPSRDALARLKSRGVAIFGTATTADEAALLEQAGVTAVVAQGAEAGAHRGTFAGSFEAAMIPTLQLVASIRDRVATPVIASGGLMDGRDIAESLARGASAAQLGTAFLACPECGISESYKQAILSARADTTVITRAFSGRPARGLANAFIERLAGRENIILPFPLQNILTRPMRNAAAKRGEPGYQSLWAGRGVTRARTLPAAELVRRLVEEMKEAGVVWAQA
jgi:nitronate monooxygenase